MGLFEFESLAETCSQNEAAEGLGGGRMKSCGCQMVATGRTETTGVTASMCTSTTATAAAATGAAVCRTIHSGQWSASVSTAWTWATWMTVITASSARHTSTTI